MKREKRITPVRKRSRIVPAILAIAMVILGFATLMTRLLVTQEGYRLSVLRADIVKLENENRLLGLTEAELSSHERLRALAPKYRLGPPRSGQVVLLP